MMDLVFSQRLHMVQPFVENQSMQLLKVKAPLAFGEYFQFQAEPCLQFVLLSYLSSGSEPCCHSKLLKF